MLLELARQLIEGARLDETEPIPVIFNLSSWKEIQTLPEWLTEQLNIVYYVPKKIAPSWVESNKMLLLLDGLDEVREDRRAKCIDAINQFRMEHGLTPLAVCCRIEEYSRDKTTLAFEEAISLQPLTSDKIHEYIDFFGTPWQGLRLALKKDEVLEELANTPLMLSIMVLAYSDILVDDLSRLDTLKERRAYLL